MDDAKIEQLSTVVVDTFSFTIVGFSAARLIGLIVYSIFLGFYFDSNPDILNGIEGLGLIGVILYGAMLGFNPKNKYVSLREKLPSGIFIITPIIVGLCSLGIAALRYYQYNKTCHSCPTYVTIGEPDCATNPYAPTSTVDWTEYDSYDSETLLETTLANNPDSNLPGDPILDFLPQCWYIGCSDCHPRYGWRVWLLAGSIFDCLCNLTFGFVLICIKHGNGL
tara:strand:+ start:226 stop:894 length:669 start_codon:yes stop_codon:yes gene_type:complete